MYIYNVTVNIEKDVHDEWLQWMKEVHIPDVLATGIFIDNRICHVMVEEEQGITYSLQYRFKDLRDLERYQKEHAPRLQAEHSKRFQNKFAAFRTILRIDHEDQA